MKEISIRVPDRLAREVDRVAEDPESCREEDRERELELRHREGYERQPVEPGEFDLSEDERPQRCTIYRRWGKRAFDLGLVLPLGVILLALGLLLALLVRLRLGSPVLFRQVRPGLGGEPFTLYKLRTMRDLRDAHGELLPDEKRLTPLGRFLRRTSLDELPTLWNVLRGEMSLVGPRPLLLEYLPRYTPEQARRHEVKPGITGWAQVHGRNALSWEEKFDHDVWYVDHLSLGLDLRILGRTLLSVIRREGISAEGHATMPPFTGRPMGRPEGSRR